MYPVSLKKLVRYDSSELHQNKPVVKDFLHRESLFNYPLIVGENFCIWDNNQFTAIKSQSNTTEVTCLTTSVKFLNQQRTLLN